MSMKKGGGADRSSRQNANFRQCLDSNGLKDLGFLSSWFTWAVDRSNHGIILARLDRVVATTKWCGKFPRARLFHLANSASDHSVLMLKLEQAMRQPRNKKIFHFEAMWLKHEQCEEVVREAWETGIHMGRENTMEHCLENCRIALTAWNLRVFGHVGKNLEHVQKKLQSLEA